LNYPLDIIIIDTDVWKFSSSLSTANPFNAVYLRKQLFICYYLPMVIPYINYIAEKKTRNTLTADRWQGIFLSSIKSHTKYIHNRSSNLFKRYISWV